MIMTIAVVMIIRTLILPIIFTVMIILTILLLSYIYIYFPGEGGRLGLGGLGFSVAV